MKIPKSFLATVLIAMWIFLVPSSYAETEFILVNGEHAVIEGKKFILIDRNSKRWVAPDGRYNTRDERYTITVKGNEIIVKDHMKDLR